jgi:hypothetical protein
MRRTTITLIAITLAACGSTTTASPSPVITAQPSPWLSSATFRATELTCGDLFTAPPFDALPPVPGISVRVIDKAHFEVTHVTDRDYYLKVVTWSTEDNLVCGRGITGHDGFASPLFAGTTVQAGGGSTVEVPVTVAIWDRPCGEACSDPPIGEIIVPISMVEPPPPTML